MKEIERLSHQTFKKYQKLIYDAIGISLSDHKKTLVESRLRNYLLLYHMDNYDALYEKIVNDKTKTMLRVLENAMTTNVTAFFRETEQWKYLKNNLLQIVDLKQKKVRIWSAGCSSGQEPYTIMIFLKENLPDVDKWDIKILATDISQDILKKALAGVYTEKDVEGLPKYLIQKYFFVSKNEKGQKEYTVVDALKQHIIFKTFNLITGNFEIFKNKFHMIFCRNVMIYFDKSTQNLLFEKFANILEKNGRLLLGHSESIYSKKQIYRMIIPSIYQLS